MKTKSLSMMAAIFCASLIATAFVQPIQAEQTTEQTRQEKPLPKQLQEVQARQQAMKTQLDLIKKTDNLKERQQLLDEHLKTMLAQVRAMAQLSPKIVDPSSQEAVLEQRAQLITELMDQMIGHYEMQLTCYK
jgi:flagellar biosynthesis/type III secretory pathway M-ring protein FliF/YscJ